MSVASPQGGELFSIRIIKTLLANPALQWANTYEIVNNSGLDVNDLRSAGLALANFEARFHSVGVQFSRLTISTHVPDGEPYDPLSFVTVPLSLIGLRQAVGELAPLALCLRAQFSTPTGRQGFRLYRGALYEADVTAPAGVPRLAAASDLQADFDEALLPLDGYYGQGDAEWRLVLATASSVRDVVSISPAGVSVKKLNNKYFDKAP